MRDILKQYNQKINETVNKNLYIFSIEATAIEIYLNDSKLTFLRV